MRSLLQRLFLSIGFACIVAAGLLYIQRNNPYRLAFKEVEQVGASENKHEVMPLSITIDSIDTVLRIIPAKKTGKVWQTTDLGVSYLSDSPIPGEMGNSILYGHNWSNLLGKLPKVVPGDIISISFMDGSIKDFTVLYTAVVNPDQTSILQYSSDKRITLYTCTGFLDSQRFVVTAILK